jgi:hypothetical protein
MSMNGDDDDASSYKWDDASSAGGSIPSTPQLQWVRGEDCVSAFLGAAAAAGPSLASRPLVSFFNPQEAAGLVDSMVADVMASLQRLGVQVSAERALLLLQATGSVARVQDAFSREMDAGAAAGGERLFASTAWDSQAPPPPPPGPFECAASGEDFPSAQEGGAAALACGHYFSGGAWSDKLRHLGRAFPSGEPAEARCMADRCALRVPLSWWLRALPPAAHAALREACVRSVLLRAPGAVPCPGAGCETWCVTGLGAGAGGKGMDVRCPAGHNFCSGCGETQVHQPASCTQVRAWNKPANNEGAMEIWKATVVNGERRAWDCPSCGAGAWRKRAGPAAAALGAQDPPRLTLFPMPPPMHSPLIFPAPFPFRRSCGEGRWLQA